ncbi:FAD:protein FMN transferase [Leeuwenhoekiella sp. H156]|uniref:FAD:protein FMN transferase n=1 Tax=Leeuwenhoekiella sp. H156 TaxID=3450128 RepID=UPI003FA48DA8
MKFSLKSISALLFGALVLAICTSCEPERNLVVYNGQALGTSYQLQFYAPERFDLVKQFDSTITAINKSMSTYQADSDISRINAGDTTIVVDAMFKEVFALAQQVYNATDGYYDPTVGVLANAYGFGPDKPLKKLDSITIDSLMQYVGLDKLTISQQGKLQKNTEHIYLDFNSIAKGYCIDRIGKMLEQNGVEDYLIELGGELLAKGKNLDKNQAWRVGIENINAPVEQRTYTEAVSLNDKGMAGSGNYRKYRQDSVTGKKYVHTINPITGSAEQSDVLSATVIAPTCAEADAWATAFMALGFERSKAVIAKNKDLAAYLMYSDQTEDSVSVFVSERFKPYLVEPNK